MPQPREYPSNAQRQAAYRRRTDQARTQQLVEKALPPLPAISNMPGEARWTGALRQVHWLLETIISEMEEYKEERSEQWQESEKGWAFAERLESLQDVLNSLEATSG